MKIFHNPAVKFLLQRGEDEPSRAEPPLTASAFVKPATGRTPSEGELPPRQLPHSPSELLRGNHKNRKKHSESPWKLLTSFASRLQTLAGNPEEEIIRKNSEKNKKAKSVQMCSCRGGSDGRRVNLSPFLES